MSTVSLGPAVALQRSHFNTSSTDALLAHAQPKYAVISACLPAEGTNRTYRHPRKETVDALSARLGGAGSGTIHAFPSAVGPCASATASQWVDEPASDRSVATTWRELGGGAVGGELGGGGIGGDWCASSAAARSRSAATWCASSSRG